MGFIPRHWPPTRVGATRKAVAAGDLILHRIVSERKRSMDALASDSAAHETIGILRFKILGQDMCIILKHVLKVLPLMELQIVPDAPGYVKGLMNLQGNSVPGLFF
ncbi:MAG: chemotaxis protein CheW [Planctomycetota bacterium]